MVVEEVKKKIPVQVKPRMFVTMMATACGNVRRVNAFQYAMELSSVIILKVDKRFRNIRFVWN